MSSAVFLLHSSCHWSFFFCLVKFTAKRNPVKFPLTFTPHLPARINLNPLFNESTSNPSGGSYIILRVPCWLTQHNPQLRVFCHTLPQKKSFHLVSRWGVKSEKLSLHPKGRCNLGTVALLNDTNMRCNPVS
jgi:hypothetical protein